MTPTNTPAAELAAHEERALRSLLGLYAAETRLYGEIRALSLRQGEVIRAGRGLSELRDLLVAKRDRLDAIARLEQAHAPDRAVWERDRSAHRGGDAVRLHAALREVGTLIEDILELEEQNDRLLLAVEGA